MSDDWICSKCKKEPEVMHSFEPNICAKCYDAQEPPPPPEFNQGDRVSTPFGVGTVDFVRFAGPEPGSVATVAVELDSKRNTPGYGSSMILAELVKLAPKRVSRNQRGKTS